MLLPFLRQEGDVLFQQDIVRSHTAAAMQRVIRGVQQLPWPARSPDLSPIEHVWDVLKRELFLQSLPHHCRIKTTGARCLVNVSQDDIRHLCDRLHARILQYLPSAYVAARWVDCVFMRLFGHPLL